ncbi:MAG: N-acetylmuramoyl-L-alanine amidase [Clostridia bacterium]|nr:N-acetylmuramoyl-L-alanine amidase [Clostridia bacterium]
MDKKIIRITTITLLIFSMLIFAVGLSRKGEKTTACAAVVNTDLNTVIIDPGHGGVDGGAVGVGGEVEKEINLAISLKLRDILEKAGYKVIMTRDTDISIHDESAKTIRAQKTSDLHNRLKIINDNPDAVFISVHQNTIGDRRVHGGQMFYSPNNACSKMLAACIQDSFRENVQPDNNKTVKQAGKNLFLLYNAQIPAVLCECAFLSNAQDVKDICSEEYQQKIAEAIFKGIENYLGR